ncbi:ABC transporter permease [Consotaella aegiceratis]|uniref:ABC transporter permease n=1 Tax=Consotaella aegiceratis TaxID=3097961 RepID=UPI002F40A746
MRRVFRDLFVYNPEFAIGSVLVAIIIVFSAASVFSPYPSYATYVVAPDVPPGLTYWLGTNSRGQDMVWQLSVALRNTLLFGLGVALLSRIVALVVGLVSGYLGGIADRIIMSINDTFLVIPAFPVLVLVFFILRSDMSWTTLILVMAALGWPYDARLIRSVAISLRTREFTEHAVYAGMSTRQILFQEHLPYVLPIMFSTFMNNMIWSIGMEITLAVLGLTDIGAPTIGVTIFWANQYTALTAGIWWWIAVPVVAVVLLFIGLFLLSVSMNEYIDPRTRLDRVGAR